MRIEIALLLYKRPDHAREVLDSLEANGVREVRVFVDCSQDPGVARVQDRMIAEITSRPGISVDVHRHREHRGLAASVRFALASVFERAEAAIVLEDDCVVRPGGIDFFREGLTALRYDRRVRSICGYLHPCQFVRGGGDPLLLQRFSTWGWATWRDRWRDYDADLGRVVQRLRAQDVRLEDLGADLAELCRCEDYLENRMDIWSLNWILEHYATGTYCVYPCDSMIDNIGFDGSGQNCEESPHFATAGRASGSAWRFEQLFHCVENEDMLRRFLDQHGLKAYPKSTRPPPR